MPTYVAMPRGINLGGHKKIKMDELRAALEAAGYSSVKTYIQSGNIVFKSKNASPATISKKIEALILEKFGHTVSVIVRTADELARTATKNPLLRQPGIDPEKLHVMFLSAAPAPAAIEKVRTFVAAPEQIVHLDKEIFFYLPNGMANSFLMKKPVDRILAVTTTTRNWRTVNAIHQMCVDCD